MIWSTQAHAPGTSGTFEITPETWANKIKESLWTSLERSLVRQPLSRNIIHTCKHQSTRVAMNSQPLAGWASRLTKAAMSILDIRYMFQVCSELALWGCYPSSWRSNFEPATCLNKFESYPNPISGGVLNFSSQWPSGPVPSDPLETKWQKAKRHWCAGRADQAGQSEPREGPGEIMRKDAKKHGIHAKNMVLGILIT